MGASGNAAGNASGINQSMPFFMKEMAPQMG